MMPQALYVTVTSSVMQTLTLDNLCFAKENAVDVAWY